MHNLTGRFIVEALAQWPVWHLTEAFLAAGKYLSVLAALPQIKATGATAVMLTPVTIGGAGLGPFNRAPYSFFAPEVDFASGPYTDSAVWELRSLVKGLHEAGIEVYLQASGFPKLLVWICRRPFGRLRLLIAALGEPPANQKR